MASTGKVRSDFKYDVCLSFAGEDRTYVYRVAELLKQEGIRVFYDEYEAAELWGKDLYTYLNQIYQHQSYYCVLFASANYANKAWTNHERESSQARAFSESREYILPARFDDTPIPGVLNTMGGIDLRRTNPEQLVNLIKKKLDQQDKALRDDQATGESPTPQAVELQALGKQIDDLSARVPQTMVYYPTPTSLPITFQLGGTEHVVGAPPHET